MAIPTTFYLVTNNDQFIEWTIIDGISGSPVNDGVVTAKLYSGRNINNPSVTPGAVVAGINNLPLTYVPNSNGIYRGAVASTFAPDLTLAYVLTVDMVSPTVGTEHWEVTTIITTRTT